VERHFTREPGLSVAGWEDMDRSFAGANPQGRGFGQVAPDFEFDFPGLGPLEGARFKQEHARVDPDTRSVFDVHPNKFPGAHDPRRSPATALQHSGDNFVIGADTREAQLGPRVDTASLDAGNDIGLGAGQGPGVADRQPRRGVGR